MKSNLRAGSGFGAALAAVWRKSSVWPWCCALLLACTQDLENLQPGEPTDAGEHTASDHAHDHDADAGSIVDSGSSHHVRDLETQPCTAETWRDLGIDLRECQLSQENLEGETLRRVNLTDADLSGAKLTSTDLFNAKLVRANLALAGLEGASLVGVDLSAANLTGATLVGADLTAAVLTDAMLEGAVTDTHTTCPNGNTGPCW